MKGDQCAHCHNDIDFTKHNRLRDVKLFEWKSSNKSDQKAIFCSEDCFDKDTNFIPDIMCCCVCAKLHVPNWIVCLRYERLGGWTHYRAACSEACQRKILSTESSYVRQCWTCKTNLVTETLLRCSRCKMAYYCSEKCQFENWMHHKLQCK